MLKGEQFNNQPLKPDRNNEFERKAEEILKDWFENSPVHLASSSEVRKSGLQKTGFMEGNIKIFLVPDNVEDEVFRSNRANTGLVIKCAKAKGKILETAPEKAFGIALDTLVGYYDECSDEEHPEKIGSWSGHSMKKPESIEHAKRETEKLFLQIMLNHLKFENYLKRIDPSGQVDFSDGGGSDLEFQKMDYASGIHAITSLNVRFPGSVLPENYWDRIIARPRLLYEIIENLDVIMENVTVESLAFCPVNDGTNVGHKVEEIVEEIYSIMKKEKVDPKKICGGVAYSLEAVRNFLKIEELADIVPDEYKSKIPDRSIYSGYPATLVKNVLRQKALELAKN